jgi:DnaK suppressor protein
MEPDSDASVPTRKEAPMPKKKTREDRERYEVLKQMLEDRRTEIHDKLRFLRETLPAEAELVKDTEEQSVDDFVQSVDFVLMEMKSETLRKIDEAIQRLEAGTYGACTECGTDIAAPRLKALPFADLCRECQEQEERRRNEEGREVRGFEARFSGESQFGKDA